jgi:hypothetical protein
MAEYRVPEFTLEQYAAAAAQMLIRYFYFHRQRS